MHEWLKYGIGAGKWLLTFVGAAYVFKKVEEWRQVRHMREQIYGEMAENYERLANRRHLVTSYEGLKRLSISRFLNDLNVKVTVYRHYKGEDGGQIFALKEAGAIDAIYFHYNTIDLMAQNVAGRVSKQIGKQ
jgi:hypothetical protein